LGHVLHDHGLEPYVRKAVELSGKTVHVAYHEAHGLHLLTLTTVASPSAMTFSTS
jgi:hypothetical protein